MCPKPPDAPEEGVQEYLPIPIPIEPEKLCALNDEVVNLVCPTFLNVLIHKVVYGRNEGKELCDGEKPKDNFQPAGGASCFDDSKSEEVAIEFMNACHGSYNCSHTVPTLVLATACDGMRREVKIEHLCSKFKIQKVITSFHLLIFCNHS